MNKTSLIFFGIISLLVVAIAVTTYIQNRETVTSVTGVTYTDFDIVFNTADGDTVKMGNFLTDPSVQADEQNSGLYFLGNKIELQPTTGALPPYAIAFDKGTGSFNITLLQKPFGQSRNQAEVYLKNLLQIDKNKMCSLQYMVTVPGYVDTAASGIDYRFSFCPGAIQL